jgi:hypothetical protein
VVHTTWNTTGTAYREEKQDKTLQKNNKETAVINKRRQH